MRNCAIFYITNLNIKNMRKIKKTLLCGILLLASLAGSTQVKFGNNPTTINANSLLELESTNKGLLLPRVALTQTTLPSPLSANVQGMTVFNTATINDVAPGIYYNDGTKWLSVSSTSWSLTGNAGTTAGINFIGTTDSTDSVFKIKNIVSGWLNNPLLNTSFGFNSLQLTATGNDYRSFGTNALTSNTTGAQNTAIGAGSLQYSTTGYLNTATGALAMQYNIFGGLNTAYGTQCMQSNFSGTSNAAFGYSALNVNQDGNNNTAVGSLSMGANLHGSNNVAIGYQALQSNITGANNTALGYDAGSSLSSGDNNIVIGNNAQPSAPTISNEVTVGNASNNSYRIYAAGWTNASDRNLKHGIKELPIGLDFVMGLKPVEFIYNNARNEARALGFIAQDVQNDMVQNKMDKSYELVSNLDNKYLGLNTTELIPVLTKAIQEQQKIIEDQNRRIEKLEKLLMSK